MSNNGFDEIQWSGELKPQENTIPERLCECGLTKWWCDTWGVPWCYRDDKRAEER